jgi:eukaryotic-like serine/threonine-protein kinase
METIETLGKYEIRRTLGRGAMGTVYEGWDPIIARRVAIKTVHLPHVPDQETDEALVRFRREAQAAGRLNHPNIVGIFDYGETNELAYIVMEFVDGPPLKSALDRQERFSLPATVRVMEDLLAGLQFSHDRGVIHRDIKPANVMLTGSGQAKIADFGIARIESSLMTQAGTVLGTPAYMSPEQFMGQVVDLRTDIYSAGVLLYQLLTGDRPFDGSMSAIMHKALNTDPPAPSLLSVATPPSFDAVIRRAMAKRPEDRYQSATAFAAAIRAAVSGRAGPASEAEATMIAPPVRSSRPGSADASPTPRGHVPRALPPRRLHLPIIAAASMVALLAALGAGWWALQPVPAETRTQAAANTAHQRPPEPAAQPNLDGMRRRIAQYIADRRCTLLGGGIDDHGWVAISGFSGGSAVDDLRRDIAAIASPNNFDWRVSGVDSVFCPVLDALRQTVPGFGANGPRLGLEMADGNARLRDGDKVRVLLTMPDFTGWLQVDYIAHDNTVQHLYPQFDTQKDGIKADAPRSYASGETVDLGQPSWEIGPPYGMDVIIAVASSDPLFSRPRPGNGETADVYLRDLQGAIDIARQRGASLAGAVLTLEALPK